VGIIEILLDIAFSIIGAIFELALGLVGAIIQFFWLPLLLIIAVWLVYLHIQVRKIEIDARYVLEFDTCSVGYDTKPPNFRNAFSDELGMRNSCGCCTHCGKITSEEPVCTKYGVKYKGHGCLDRTVCNDFDNVLFH